MNYYWFDRKVHEEGRSASGQSKIFKELIKIFTPCSLDTGSLGLQESKESFICFVHAGNSDGCTQEAFENIADKSQQRFVALVGYDSDRIPEVKKDGSVVSLKRVCLNRGLERFGRMPKLIESFKQSAEEGKPKWELLVPELETENSTALYLLLLAQKKGLGVAVPPGLRAEAYMELQEIAKNHPSSGVELPQVAEELNQRYLESIGKLLTECVCK